MHHIVNTVNPKSRSSILHPRSSIVPGRAAHRRANALRSPGSLVRSGFTLVEMMVVVVIIAVLMGLILPAIGAARVKANEARVIVEIKGLEAAIAAFKAKYGVEPPSRFSLHLSQNAWSNDPASMAIVRQIWPQFDFTMNDPNPNGSGTTPTTTFPTAYPAFWWTTYGASGLNMNSGECLLFFLGGVIPIQNQVPGLGNAVPTGFAKNPVYPFSPPNISSNREGPFFEFTDINRIKDIDQNGVNEWYDQLPSQSKPYLYFSSYDGRGYNLLELPNNGAKFTIAGFESLHDVYRVSSTAGLLPLQTPASSPTGTSAAINGALNSSPQKPQTFQIISPGYDGEYGSGGVYNPQLLNSGLVGYDASGTVMNPDTRQFDNLTNFSGGRLKP